MGKPGRPKGRIRTVEFMLVLTPEEKALLVELAKRAGLNQSAAMRRGLELLRKSLDELSAMAQTVPPPPHSDWALHDPGDPVDM